MTLPTAPSPVPSPPVVPQGIMPGQHLLLDQTGAWEAVYDTSYQLGPTGYFRESFPRTTTPAADVAAALASGTITMTKMPFLTGDVISGVTFVSGATAAITPTHQWAVLCTNVAATPVVLAVSADLLTAAWAANTPILFTFGAAYTVPAPNSLYIGLMVVAGTVPSIMAKQDGTSAINKLPPISCGTSSTGQTTPPAVGATLTAITGGANKLYALAS